jgi:D-alanine transfer protein
MPDWDKELANARELNKNASRARPPCGWTKRFTRRGYAEQWDDTPVVPAQIAVFRKTVQLLKEHHVQVIAIVDPVNPWALYNTDTFRRLISKLKPFWKNQIPYLDMYAMPYQNGWNWDRLHPPNWHGFL